MSSFDKRYAHLYDNIWVRLGKLEITSSGIGRSPDWLGITHKQARKHVSDHAPVYFTLGEKRVDTSSLSASPGSQRGQNSVASTGPGCIDLNAASAQELGDLKHIGPSRARSITAYRPFEAVSDLRGVHGLGPSRVSDIRDGGKLCPL